MSENKQNENQKNNPNEQNPRDVANQFGSGKMTLNKPICSNNKEFKELEYDFTSLTGWEFADAMDSDRDGDRNAFKLTDKQALALFAAAAAKKTQDADAYDIKRNLLIEDAIKAIQIAAVFFVASSRAGNSRITNS